MRIIQINLLILLSLLVIACNNNSDSDSSEPEEENTSDPLADVQLPEDRDLTPFTLSPEEAVNPQNLYREVKAWHEAWQDKTVQVIVWMWGGVGNMGTHKSFSNPDNPGLILMKSDISDEELAKIGAFGGAEYVVLEGIANLDGSSIFLSNVKVLQPYEGDSLPKGQQITPEEAGTGTPYNPVDIYNSMLAWQNKQVTVDGISTLALKGNVIGFDDEAGNEVVRAVTSEEFEQESNKPQHVQLTGKINRYDEEEETLSLYECTRLN